MASSVTTHPGGIELVGMLGFVSESDDDLLVTNSSLGSNLDPSCRSHHPSRECFMAETPEGYVEEVEYSSGHSRDHTPPPAPAPVQGADARCCPDLPLLRRREVDARHNRHPSPMAQGDERTAHQWRVPLLARQKELKEM